MIAVIQCAGTKRPDAGMLVGRGGRSVLFVGQPDLAPPSQSHALAHPDGRRHDGRTWRDYLLGYNARGQNPLGLSKAFELYVPPAAPDVYRRLVETLGENKVYILSAGWGLIRAGFLTPSYDITFTSAVRKKAPWKHRRRTDVYHDFRHLDDASGHEVIFLGGKDYVPLFCALTGHLETRRTVFYNSRVPPVAPGCVLSRFETDKKMNWQYDCARAVLREA